MQHSRQELSGRGFGVFGVAVVDRFAVAMRDGCHIALKLWFPCDNAQRVQALFKGATVKVYTSVQEGANLNKTRFGSILEYLPYRKSEWSANRDHLRHPWMASHGFVVVRADIRGAGDSQGLIHDEYAPTEQDDACQIIEWLSAQDWSNGNVGMYGKSWGGFNGLQVAFHQPKALKAVISLYSTDDRFAEDCHFKGGCVVGGQMLSWASIMFAWNARPPHPANGPRWKEEWLSRLENASECWARQWLEHQTYDDYWKQGSIREDYSRVAVPVLAVGGWQDGYVNAVFNMVERLPNCKAIIGPWSHEWPDIAVPGPNMAYMRECLNFWRAHLGSTGEFYSVPRLRWFQESGLVPPQPLVPEWPGHWTASEDAKPWTDRTFVLDNQDLRITTADRTEAARQSLAREIYYHELHGVTCGEWLSVGDPDCAVDQRSANAVSVTWLGDVVEEDELALFGLPRVSLEFRIDNDCQGQIAARLCDVFPDEKGVRIISYTIRNLNRDDDQQTKELQQGKWYTLEFPLNSLGYSVQRGHRLSLSLATGYWPTSWTPRKATVVSVRNAVLRLPIVDKAKATAMQKTDMQLPEGTMPMMGPHLRKEAVGTPRYDRYVRRGLSDDLIELRVETDDGGERIFDVDAFTHETSESVYSTRGGDPLSAEARIKRTVHMEFCEGREKADVCAHSRMWADADSFYLENHLRVDYNGDKLFERKWSDAVKRNLV